MHCQLVAVKVRVVRGANERVNANGFTLDQLRFKRLNRQAVQSRSRIQEHWMAPGNFVENGADLRSLALNHLFRAAERVDVPEIFKPTYDERIVKNQRHLLRQYAFIQL